MSCSSGLVVSSPSATTMLNPSNSKNIHFSSPLQPTTRRNRNMTVSCQNSNSITNFDLYDLLGIDRSSDPSQIKMAYRSLQKRCHPDIAGPAGHDMAIILNDAYSILSDPNLRSSYDKEQSKFREFQGYTGKPLYSTWLGSEKEERAVFVDEVKCVGCLKCALFAKNTFAIESRYGRARVVAQWADPEEKIYDAIQICPVDCISVVERSDLAALEFLMSKQPRGNVRMSAGNAVGARVSNIFADVKKFQSRFEEINSEASQQNSKESDLLREARMSAIHAIRSISNLWYWQSPKDGGSTTQESPQNLILIAEKSSLPGTEKLRDAVAARQRGSSEHNIQPTKSIQDEYWTPKTLVPDQPTWTNTSQDSELVLPPSKHSSRTNNNVNRKKMVRNDKDEGNPLRWIFPMGIAVFAAITIRLQIGGESLDGGNGDNSYIRDHMAGSLAAEIVNSYWLQTILAGVTWYVIGIMVVELIDALRKK